MASDDGATSGLELGETPSSSGSIGETDVEDALEFADAPLGESVGDSGGVVDDEATGVAFGGVAVAGVVMAAVVAGEDRPADFSGGSGRSSEMSWKCSVMVREYAHLTHVRRASVSKWRFL